jgi:hypothetical protein
VRITEVEKEDFKDNTQARGFSTFISISLKSIEI